MNLKQLEAFVSVADTRSFSKTAKELYLTQPTISAHISSLEAELNTRLFIRNTKEVRLSERGKCLYQYARQMLDLEEEISREFGTGEEPGADRVAIAASTIPSQYILPELLAEFKKENPLEKFELFEGDSASVIERIQNGQAQIGFAGTAADDPGCRNIPFYKDRLVVMTPVSEKYKAMKGREFDLALFNEEPLIMREIGSGTRKETEQYLADKGIRTESLKIVASMNSQEAIKKSVRKGMGITVISNLAAADYEASGQALVFQFPGEILYRDLNIVCPRKLRMRPSVRRLVHLAESYFAEERESVQEEKTT